MSEMLVESMVKDVWNEQGNIKMLFEKLKEGASSMNISLQSEKVSFKEI